MPPPKMRLQSVWIPRVFCHPGGVYSRRHVPVNELVFARVRRIKSGGIATTGAIGRAVKCFHVFFELDTYEAKYLFSLLLLLI